MAKRLTVTTDDGDDEWIELSGGLTREVDALVWEGECTVMEAAQEVLEGAGLELANGD